MGKSNVQHIEFMSYPQKLGCIHKKTDYIRGNQVISTEFEIYPRNRRYIHENLRSNYKSSSPHIGKELN